MFALRRAGLSRLRRSRVVWLAAGLCATSLSGAGCLPAESCQVTNLVCNPQNWQLYVATAGAAATSAAASAAAVVTRPVVYAVGFRRITAGNTDWWLKKYDSAGVEDTSAWNKQIDGGVMGSDRPYSCAVDSTGSVYIVGTKFVAGQDQNWWLKKFNPDGTEAAGWDKSFDGGNFQGDEAYAVHVDSADGVFVVGRRNSPGVVQDWWIKKYNTAGTEDTASWDKTLNGASSLTDDPFAVTTSADGGVFVVGEMEVPVTFQNVQIKKFSATGTVDGAWDKNFDGTNNVNDWAQGVRVDGQSNVYVTGYLNQAVTSENWFIKKYDSAGNEIMAGWNKIIDGGSMAGGEFLRALVLDASGNVFVGGRLNPTNTNDAWSLKKFSPDGTEDAAWNKSFHADAPNLLDEITGLAADAQGNIYAVGLCSINTSGEDFCVKKYNPDGSEDAAWFKTYDGGVGLNEQGTGVCVFNQPQ